MGVCLFLFSAWRRAVAQNVPVAAASKAFWQHLPACRLYFASSECPVTFGTWVETSVDPIFIFYHFQGSHRSSGKVRGSRLWVKGFFSVCVCVCSDTTFSSFGFLPESQLKVRNLTVCTAFSQIQNKNNVTSAAPWTASAAPWTLKYDDEGQTDLF